MFRRGGCQDKVIYKYYDHDQTLYMWENYSSVFHTCTDTVRSLSNGTASLGQSKDCIV